MKLNNYLYIHPTVPILFVLSIIFDFFSSLLIVYGIVLLHESAHLVCALFLNVRLKKAEILPFGITLVMDEHYIKEPLKEIAIAVAGPVINILLSVIIVLFAGKGYIEYEFAGFIAVSSGMLALINLMPAMPLDGGRILKAALTRRWGFLKAFNFTMLVTKITAAIMIIAGITLLFFSAFNFSLFLISAFLIVNIISERRAGSMMVMRDILYSHSKLTKGKSGASAITARYDIPARLLLRCFSYNSYYLIHVLDDNLDYLSTITETQVINGIMNKGMRVQLAELI